MARTKGALGKFKVEKEVVDLLGKVEALTENSTTPEMNEALLKAGMGLGLHTLIRAASGDKSMEGISATNMVSAADKLLQLGIKIYGEEAFKALQQEATKEQKESTSKVESTPQPTPSNYGFIKPFESKEIN